MVNVARAFIDVDCSKSSSLDDDVKTLDMTSSIIGHVIAPTAMDPLEVESIHSMTFTARHSILILRPRGIPCPELIRALASAAGGNTLPQSASSRRWLESTPQSRKLKG